MSSGSCVRSSYRRMQPLGHRAALPGMGPYHGHGCCFPPRALGIDVLHEGAQVVLQGQVSGSHAAPDFRQVTRPALVEKVGRKLVTWLLCYLRNKSTLFFSFYGKKLMFQNMHMYIFSFLFLLFIYLLLRQRTHRGEAEREFQAGSVLSVQSLMQGSNPQTVSS